jgi:hypothetical protein
MNKTTENSMKKNAQTLLAVCAMLTLGLAGCQRVEDPFVDRVEAPVLIVVEGTTGYLAGGGLTSEPAVTFKVDSTNFASPVSLSVSIYTLDKSGILDKNVGIDSIPVANLAIRFLKRDGTKLADLTTDASGKITTSRTWAELGLAGVEAIAKAKEAKTVNIPVMWSGQYGDQPFVRYSQVVFSKPKY